MRLAGASRGHKALLPACLPPSLLLPPRPGAALGGVSSQCHRSLGGGPAGSARQPPDASAPLSAPCGRRAARRGAARLSRAEVTRRRRGCCCCWRRRRRDRHWGVGGRSRRLPFTSCRPEGARPPRPPLPECRALRGGGGNLPRPEGTVGRGRGGQWGVPLPG